MTGVVLRRTRLYPGFVRQMIVRLMTLLAVLLLPLGMQPAAAAAAAPVGDHHMAMPAQHCPKQAPNRDKKAGFAECTMACSAALPAAEQPAGHAPILVCAPSAAAAARILSGLHPDTVTPPPKRS